MTAAALVTGHCLIMKPSEQSPVVAARFMQLLRRAGVPPGVVNFLPGAGRDIGAYLVEHPTVDLIAFTGGFKMSGGGTKAGGPDYLPHFMFPRAVTENQMRRGFAPLSLRTED